MSSSCAVTPATLWRAFFVGCVLSVTAFGAVPVSAPPDLAQIGRPAAEEARDILEEFRKSGIPGAYFLEFELHALPRRGATVVYRGRFWGSRNDDGAINRVELVDGAGKIHRLLVQNGVRPAVWRLAGEQVEPIGVAASFQPAIPGVEITAFDLQMPFLYWPEATYEKIARIRGRPAHAYLFRAPAAFLAQHPNVTAARGYLDTQYLALMQTDLIGPKNTVVKTTTLMDLKKIVDPQTGADQWIPKSFDVRNEETRDKTRFLITGVALKQQFPAAVFQPASLAENIASPAPGRIVRLDR